MNKASLSAYAAWLAKHETKAPKRRSLEPVSEPEGVHVVTDTTTDEPSDPLWVQRKETKMPLMKVVMASPEAIDEIVERGRAAVALAQASKAGLEKRAAIVAAVRRRSLDTSTRIHLDDAKGKKRKVTESGEPDVRVEKKAKMTIASTQSKANATSQSTRNTQIETSKMNEKRSSVVPSNCNASSRVNLPMLEEVKYWRDVDRFSFLA